MAVEYSHDHVLIFFLYKKLENSITKFWYLNGRNKIILLCSSILPALNFTGLWDNYLFWNIYTSALPNMAICIKDSATSKQFHPYLIKKDSLNFCESNTLLNIQNWAMKEMNVPPYPEKRIYKKIEKYWTRFFPLSNVNFVIYYLPFEPVLPTFKNNSN